MTETVHHFSTEPGGTPTGPGRYVAVDDVESIEFVAGLGFQPILGEGTLVNFVTFATGTEAPMHVHVEEQFTIVLEGEMEFELDGDVRTMRPGDVAVIPPWVPHGARTKDSTCREIDVFTPPRRSLLDHAARQSAPRSADAGA